MECIAEAFNEKPEVELPAYVKTQEFSDKVYEIFETKLKDVVDHTK